ncbi:MAG TPA: hypothetical protein PLU24_06010, partial [Candidatus Omnitrophota bacterium]|nr:hypothetical protein [Candidatus Omnitrophota bacterium]
SSMRPQASTIDAVLDGLLKARSASSQLIKVKKSDITIAGQQAKEAFLSYSAPDELESAKTKMIPVNERIMVLSYGDSFYTIRFRAPLNKYSGYNKLFTHCLKTLKFKK